MEISTVWDARWRYSNDFISISVVLYCKRFIWNVVTQAWMNVYNINVEGADNTQPFYHARFGLYIFC